MTFVSKKIGKTKYKLKFCCIQLNCIKRISGWKNGQIINRTGAPFLGAMLNRCWFVMFGLRVCRLFRFLFNLRDFYLGRITDKLKCFVEEKEFFFLNWFVIVSFAYNCFPPTI